MVCGSNDIDPDEGKPGRGETTLLKLDAV